MSGDYSRWSFDPHRHFGAVLMQQGRVQTDADWNEWVATALRRVQADRLDTLGRRGGPARDARRASRCDATGGNAHHRARAHVRRRAAGREPRRATPLEWDPRLAELRRHRRRRPTTTSPTCPQPPPLPGGAGPHLVYLKAWQRERTAIEEPCADRAGARRRHHDAAPDRVAGQGAAPTSATARHVRDAARGRARLRRGRAARRRRG